MNYIKSKYKNIDDSEIKKLVISNPYTIGLIGIMKANNIQDEDKRIEDYIKSLQHLKHIKYYYVECIVYLCQYLKNINKLDLFNEWVEAAYKAAEKYSYARLIYQLNEINSTKQYDENSYTSKYSSIDKDELTKYINSYIHYRNN